MLVLDMNYKDDVFEGNRKYVMSNNGDGTVSLVDATQYITVGDALGSLDINKINAAIMGFSTCTTNIIDTKHTVEIDAYGRKKKTTINSSRNITEALYEADDTLICEKTTTISIDGRVINEEVTI